MTHNELKDIFLKLTYILRGYSLSDYSNPNSEAQHLIRFAYETNNQPFQALEDGCSYVWLTYRDRPDGGLINVVESYDVSIDKIKTSKSQLRLLNVHWIFYGDSAQDNADALRQRIFSNQSKFFLDEYDIKLNLDVPETIMVYEEVNNQWWKRVELQVGYYITSTFEENIDTLVDVDVYLDTETKEKHIEIESEEI